MNNISVEQYIKGLQEALTKEQNKTNRLRIGLSHIADADVGMSPVAQRLVDKASETLRMVE